MDKVSVLDIIDRDSEQNAQVIIRSVKGFVALTLTLEHEGDVQVVLSPAECAEVVTRLQQAITDAQPGTLAANKSMTFAHQEIKEINSFGSAAIGSKDR
jgi:hypothetical protein